MDFEEEIGSPSLPSAVEVHKEKLESDALLIFDGPQHASGLPTLNFGNRGISSITLKTYGPIVPQHSGHFGNYAPNPVFRMSNILSSMKDENGIVKIKGYYDGINITDEVKEYLDAVPDNEDEMKDKMEFKTPESVGNSYQEAIQYPSLNVRGIRSGWVGSEVRTIVPSECIAEIDVRLVIETDGYKLHDLIKKHIESLGYIVTDKEPSKEMRLKYDKIVRFNSRVSYPAFRTDINSDLGIWLKDVMVKTFGKEPVLKRTSGGSVPISPFVNTLNIPAVGVPTVNKDNNQHSPNENIKITNYIKGIETFIGILSSKFD
jgi:acetylornithine deacetylase/succinyl-diaminopimelate desuccinylase-like protein